MLGLDPFKKQYSILHYLYENRSQTMKIIFFILSFLHFLQGQDKMILKSSEEIILKDRTNSVDYNDKSSFVNKNCLNYSRKRRNSFQKWYGNIRL